MGVHVTNTASPILLIKLDLLPGQLMDSSQSLFSSSFTLFPFSLSVLSMASTESIQPPAVSPEISSTATPSSTTPPLKTPSRAVWSRQDDEDLCDELQKAKAAGNQSENGWKECVWHSCSVRLKGSELRSGGAPKTPASCENHWRTVCSMVF